MSREDALAWLGSNAWATYKPGKVESNKDMWKREDIFTGVHITCTKEEWHEIVIALNE